MPLTMRDVTAGNVLLLTFDNSGQICLGDGTPVSALTVHGVAVIDSSGNITNQRAVSGSFAMASGSVSVAPGGTAIVTTLPGVIPTVQLDAYWPNIKTTHVIGPPDHCVSTYTYSTPTHKQLGITAGQFQVANLTQPDDTGLCSTGIPDDITYRWM